MFCFLRLDHYIYCECTTQLPVVYCMHCNTKIVSDAYSMICMVLLCKSVEVIVLTETTMSRFIVFHFGCSFFCPPTRPPHPFVFLYLRYKAHTYFIPVFLLKVSSWCVALRKTCRFMNWNWVFSVICLVRAFTSFQLAF